MTNISARIFWTLVLFLQLGCTGIGVVVSRGYSMPITLFALACCVPLVGLIAQRRILSHNFWAGFVGIVAPYALILLLAIIGLAIVLAAIPAIALTDRLLALAVVAALIHLLSFYAAFVYVYGSPQIWLGPNNSFKPTPLRGSDDVHTLR